MEPRFSQKIKDYVKEVGGRTKASKNSFKEIEKLLKTTEATRSDGRLRKGKMYCFRYFTPDEKAYDSYPVVIGLGKSDDGHQLGINLHYIPYLSRIRFVQSFLDSYAGSMRESTMGSMALNAASQHSINILNYFGIKGAFGNKFNMTRAIRQYKMNRMRYPIQLSYENWHLGVVNDENFFIGTNINEAQSKIYG